MQTQDEVTVCKTKVYQYLRSGEWEAVHREMTVKKKAEKSVAGDRGAGVSNSGCLGGRWVGSFGGLTLDG